MESFAAAPVLSRKRAKRRDAIGGKGLGGKNTAARFLTPHGGVARRLRFGEQIGPELNAGLRVVASCNRAVETQRVSRGLQLPRISEHGTKRAEIEQIAQNGRAEARAHHRKNKSS